MLIRASILLFLFSYNVSFAGLFDDAQAREQIEMLQKQVQEMDARIVSMEEALKNQAILELYTQIEAFKIELGKLHGQIEILNEENKLLKKQQKDFYLDLDNRLKQVEPASRDTSISLGSPPETTVTTVPSTTPASGTSSVAQPKNQPTDLSERDAYNASYNLFKEGDYSGAITQFENFLTRYPASNLAPGAAYWIGNAYYALRDFSSAIRAQQKLIENYPNSGKAPDAMLNIASCQIEMTEVAAAKTTLQNLITKYPNSEAAEKARRRLANLK
ncbi:tol-pal system protein YbgF [Nitrosomonas sp. Nm33]|uniref:tol-pal system protein YbgF n=1 Tax=Nitrosomonas sp. Nm33 TaxID=133724 RepID=UPI00089C17A0|nr:tol-pal system protein YbgF [Nitrosomonas sp. Nm33]SDY79139.1 tol-pal system protein YbgF [Nitrosomonas sp. Nm33]